MANFPGEFITILFAEDAMDGEILALILEGTMGAERIRLCDTGP